MNDLAVASPRPSTAVAEVESSRAVAEVQASFVVARKFPRNALVCIDNIRQAFTRPALAEKAKYQFARGGTNIEGPSVRSLEAIAQVWGNIRTGVKEISRTGNQSEVMAYAIDLESGYFEEKTFTVKHIRDTKQGPKPLTDERDIYELCANQGARRKRACLEAVIPGDVIDEAMDQAELTLRTKFEVTPERLKGLLEKFAEYGITQEQIERRIQRRLDAMTPALLGNLGKIFNSLKDGMSKPIDWFEAAETPDAPTKKGLRETLGVAPGTPTASPEPASATQPTSPAPEAQPAQKAALEPPIPFKDVVKMLKNSRNRDQADMVIDTVRDESYSDEQRAEAKKTYDEKWPPA